MRILILTQTFPFTPHDSTAHFMYDFADGFAKLKHQVTVLTPFHPLLKPRTFMGVRVKTFRYIWPDSLNLLGYGQTLKNDQDLPWYVYLLAPLFFIFGIINCLQTAKDERIEVINAHWILPCGFIAAVTAWLLKIPLVITLPGSDVYISNKHFFFRQMTNFAIWQAKKIVSNSQQLLRDLGVSGCVISYSSPLIPGKRTVNQPPIVASAGRLVEKKGFEYLKQALPKFVVISGLDNNKLRQRLLGIDIFVSLSIRDSKGNLDDANIVVLEAMAAGCPVIVSNLPGYKAVIKDGFNGLLINPKNKTAVIQAINRLQRSTTLRAKLGKAAKQTIRASYTPTKIARSYLKVFQESR